MATVPYIGSKISLVSKADLRYEGTLFTIDPANSTVSLSNVVCFGTEDRLQDVIPGSDTVYPFLIFKGADIKNLYVIEDVDTSAQAQSAPPNDPAIIGTTAPAQSPNAAVIAAAKAKSEAEKSENLLAQKMARTSISGKPEARRHPAGFPPRPAMPADQYGYGYQPQGMWYAPAGVPYGAIQNPSYPGLHPPPMQYAPMQYPANIPQPDPRRSQPIAKLPPQPLPSSQARFREQPSLPDPASAVLHQPGPKPVVSARPSSIPSPRDSYAGRGSRTDYAEPRRFIKPNVNAKVSEPPANAEQPSAPTEFDFQSSNARFDKESFIRNLTSPRDQEPNEAQPTDSTPNAAQPVVRKYDKTSSFFDDISLDRDERGRKENRRGQNEETFGTIAAGFTSSNYRRNFNRNRRGRPNNSTRRNDNPDPAAPHSPIRRAGQQPSRPRGSPRSGDRKVRPRRGRRSSGTNPENGSQEARPRNGKRPTGQATGITSSQTV